jgi:non-specific serine/threonine protein kinase
VNLANAELALQQYDRAEGHYLEGQRLMTELGDRYGVALALLNRGDLARLRGEHALAATLLQQALPLFREIGDARRAARAEMYLGRIAFELGELDRAAELARHALQAFRGLGFEPGCADCVALLACIAAAQGEMSRGARLFGAFETIQERLVRTVSPVDQTSREAGLQRIKAALGPRIVLRERAAGRALQFEAALDLALADRSVAESVGRRAPQRLTAREQEIAGLVAEGLTNRQIAQRLIVSERTADAHVRNIFDKLGINSRAQIAAWVTSQEHVKT